MNIGFKHSRFGLAAIAAIAGLAGMLVASPAKAVVIYDEVFALNDDHCSGGCGAALYGAVGLTQNGTAVDVTVHLLSGFSYAKDGSTDFQSFKFNGTGVVLGDITVDAHTPALAAAAGTFNGDGTGPFGFAIGCPTCGNGLNPTNTADILFHVANATLADLTHPNVPNGEIFVASVGNIATGKTGPVATGGSVCLSCDINLTSVTPVPEPASLALFGTALVGLGALNRRRNRRSKTGAV